MDSQSTLGPVPAALSGRLVPFQLAFDGNLVPHPARASGLSQRQRGLLRLLRSPDGLRTGRAGRYMHETRADQCLRCAVGLPCEYASSDGWSAMKRLEERGLARHVRRGLWRPVVRSEGW